MTSTSGFRELDIEDLPDLPDGVREAETVSLEEFWMADLEEPGPEEVFRRDSRFLLDQVEAVEQQQRLLAAQRLDLLEQVAHLHREHDSARGTTAVALGQRALRAELATAMQETEHMVDRCMETAYALANQFPKALAELRAGTISERHVQVIIAEAAPIGVGTDVETNSLRDMYTEVLLD